MPLRIRHHRVQDLSQIQPSSSSNLLPSTSPLLLVVLVVLLLSSSRVRVLLIDPDLRRRVEGLDDLLCRPESKNSVQDGLSDGTGLGSSVPIPDVTEESNEIEAGEGFDDLVDGGGSGDAEGVGFFWGEGVGGGRGGIEEGGGERRRRSVGSDGGEEGEESTRLGHGEGEEDGVSVVFEVDVVGEVLLAGEKSKEDEVSSAQSKLERKTRGGRGDSNSLQNRLLQLRHLLLLVDLGAISPEGDHRVGSSRDDRLLILGDGESPDLVLVVIERSDALLVLDVPELDESIR